MLSKNSKRKLNQCFVVYFSHRTTIIVKLQLLIILSQFNMEDITHHLPAEYDVHPTQGISYLLLFFFIIMLIYILFGPNNFF